MNEIVTYAPIAGGGWMIFMALITDTDDFNSSVVFKVIPFFLGLGCLFSGARLLGWI